MMEKIKNRSTEGSRRGPRSEIRKWAVVLIGVLVFSFLIAVQVEAAKQSTNMQVKKGKVFLNLKDADIKTVLQILPRRPRQIS